MVTKKTKPIVTISIPTRNSATFLEKCLESVKKQNYKQQQTHIIDGDSVDNTVDIAKKFHVPVIRYGKALLGARLEGVKQAEGKYILFLDSDQVLYPHTISRAVKEMEKGYDMLILGEGVYKKNTFIEKLFAADRKLIEKVKDVNPETGVLLPRFYKTSLLKKVAKNIPKSVAEKVGGQDHAIIYFEAWRKSRKVGYLRKAVRHIEPDTFIPIWKKFYRWGYTSVDAHFGKYDEMLARKERFRTGLFKDGLIRESCMSILLLVLKGIPYKMGYIRGKYRI